MNINHDLADFQAMERVLGQCVSLLHLTLYCYCYYYYYYYLTTLYKRDGSQ
jgi:hypothetical protein